jgi:hypothetical protein
MTQEQPRVKSTQQEVNLPSSERGTAPYFEDGRVNGPCGREPSLENAEEGHVTDVDDETLYP